MTGSSSSKAADTIFSNLYRLNDSIYRSEQPDSLGFAVLSSIGMKSVLNLRSDHKDNQLASRLPLHLYRVRMTASHVNEKRIIKALRILRTAPKPIVVHCRHGSDRTGLVIAMYRIIYQHWTKEKAIEEMKDGGYGFHKVYSNIPIYINKSIIEKVRKETSN